MNDPTSGPTRRRFLIGAASAASALLIGSPAAFARDDSAKPLTLKLATTMPAGTPTAKQTSRIKKRVRNGTDGTVKLKVYMGGSLGDEAATLERCANGGLAAWLGSFQGASTLIPELGVFGLPYLFPKRDSADRILDEHVREPIETLLEAKGLKLLSFGENGFRSIGSTFGFVKSTSDLKGKSLLTHGGSAAVDALSALGGTVSAAAVADGLNALAAGTADGYDATPLFLFANEYFHHTSHVTLTRHAYEPTLTVMHLDTWNELPTDVQTLVAGDMSEESTYARDKMRAIDQQLVDNFAAAEIDVHEPTSDELEAFCAAAKPAHEKFTDAYGTGLYKAITKHL